MKHDFNIQKTRKRFNISRTTYGYIVNEIIQLSEFSNKAEIQIMKSGDDSAHFGVKDKPYWTEEEMLTQPKYSATNKHLLTPIRKDWKLF